MLLWVNEYCGFLIPSRLQDEYTRHKKNMQKDTFPPIFFDETWWVCELTFYCLVPKRASKNIEGNFTILSFLTLFKVFFDALLGTTQ